MAEPTEPPVEPQLAEPRPAAEHLGVEPEVPELVDAEPVAEPAPEPVAAEPLPPREVVYVQAPTPPVARHNRGFGVLIGLLGAAAFALLYLAAGGIIIAATPGANVEASFQQYLISAAFWVPVISYAVFAVVFALIVNRAAWWAHVIGSLFVAGLSYGVSIGVLALLSDVISMTPDAAAALFAGLASSSFLLVALALARETALWFGLAIASRGRRVRERNELDRALFEQSVAERRAEYERAHPSA